MEPEEDYKALAQLNRAYMALIWKALKEDPEGLTDDEALIAEQMLDHENYHDIWEHIDELEDYMFDPATEENPFLHISVHVMLEKQLQSGQPPVVEETLTRLIERGIDPHEARHAILRVFVQEMWDVLTGQRPFDLQAYCEALEQL